MRFAREGRPFIAISAFVALALVLWAAGVGGIGVGGPVAWIVALLAVAIAAWVAYFFRDPERAGDRGDRYIVAPADGKVVLITDVDEPSFIGGRAKRVSIFMNVFSVHVNRYPVSGVVRHVRYAKGKFRNAVTPESSAENEQMSVGIDAPNGRVLVRQIAGLIARRIVTYSRDGELVHQGERMGLIRFGSRVDVFVPPDATLCVALGAQTAAGATVIAELPA
ncbi:phosphatidylserine decarboxylase proenzyme [Gemmatimonadetes bacterium T265]|nr:phosphatidylserine decarboxylase proenzyme [Gemmatimonadetes bacterium T265]